MYPHKFFIYRKSIIAWKRKIKHNDQSRQVASAIESIPWKRKTKHNDQSRAQTFLKWNLRCIHLHQQAITKRQPYSKKSQKIGIRADDLCTINMERR
jgi:hypothetical protein